MKKILIYPYSADHEPVLARLMRKYPEYYFTLMIPMSWPQVIHCDEELMSRLKTISDQKEKMEEEINASQIIILLHSDRTQIHEETVGVIKQSLTRTKKTICFEPLSEEEILSFGKMDHTNQFKYYGQNSLFLETNSPASRDHTFHKQDCIVCGVAGLLRGINTTAPLLELKDVLDRSGYHTVVVSTDSETQILGHTLFPYHILKKDAPPETIVWELNQYFCDLASRTGADILLVQFPDGLMKYSDDCYEGFGVYSFILSQALSLDYFVLSVPYMYEMFLELENLKEFQQSVKYRFGNEVDAFIIEEKEVDDFLSREEKKVIYRRISPEAVDQLVNLMQAQDCPVYAKRNLNSYRTIIAHMVELLSNQDDEF